MNSKYLHEYHHDLLMCRKFLEDILSSKIVRTCSQEMGIKIKRGFRRIRFTGRKHTCQGLNSHYFHMIGDGHQPKNRGLHSDSKDSLLKVDDHPQYREFRPWHI